MQTEDHIPSSYDVVSHSQASVLLAVDISPPWENRLIQGFLEAVL